MIRCIGPRARQVANTISGEAAILKCLRTVQTMKLQLDRWVGGESSHVYILTIQRGTPNIYRMGHLILLTYKQLATRKRPKVSLTVPRSSVLMRFAKRHLCFAALFSLTVPSLTVPLKTEPRGTVRITSDKLSWCPYKRKLVLRKSESCETV